MIEATDAAGRIFGEERLIEIASRLRASPPAGIIKAVFDAVAGYSGRPAEDDLTLVVLRRDA